MVTKEQALTCSEFHFGTCTRHIGPRGGVRERTEHWRANGGCKVWVTRPKEFRLPIKYGLKSYSTIEPWNAHQFHVAAECPLVLNPILPKIRV